MNPSEIRQRFQPKHYMKTRRTSGVGPGKNMLALARVSYVNYEEHTITLRMISGEDQEFQRVPVPITYPGAGARRFLGSMPEEGDIAVVGFMNYESDGQSPAPIILSWLIPGISSGYDWMMTQPFAPDEFPLDSKNSMFTRGVYNKVRHKLRHMNPGDVVASSSKGSDMILNEDVQLSNRRGNEIIIRDSDQSIIERACQKFTVLSGVRVYSGMVQRDAAIVPSTMFSDGVEWDTLNLSDPESGDLYTDQQLEKSKRRLKDELYPHPVFDRRGDDGKLYESNVSGLIYSPSSDPYSILQRSLSINDKYLLSDDKSRPTAVYGGKYINRISTSSSGNGKPLNGLLSGVSYTEYRLEINHTSDGTLPVSEQTDGFDADRLPDSVPNGSSLSSPKKPFIEQVMGTVVGNDPFSVKGRSVYGLPLTPVIFNSSGGVTPSMESAIGLDIGDHAATLFSISPQTPNGGRNSFSSYTKDGRLFSYISGNKSKQYSAEIALLSGLKVSSGGKIVLEAENGFEFNSGKGKGDNYGLNLGSTSGAVKVYGGGTSTDGPSNNPSLFLEGKDNVRIKSGKSVLIDTSDISTVSSNNLMKSKNGIGIIAGEGVTVTSKVYNQVTSGKASYGFYGPKDNLPTNGAFRETVFAGIAVGAADKYMVVQGDREETFLLGNHKTSILVGNITYESVAGKFSAVSGANSLEIDFVSGLSANMTVGNTSFNNIAGGFSVNAQTSVNVRATGTTVVSGAGGISLGGPGKVGGIVCGSDLDPLTGLPLSTLGMGSPGHTLILPT
jgi:hypothetical protein